MVEKNPNLSTQLIHGDERIVGNTAEVSPSISVTTTFRYIPDTESDTREPDYRNPDSHVYSRYTQQVSTRAEHILSQLNQGFALTYSSGLTAGYSALVHLAPKRLAISGGYHGFHTTIDKYRKSNTSLEIISLDDEYKPGDVCWLETPLNPTGESRDIQYYANKIHAIGGKLVVDSTFAPPPLQYPFKWGADIIMHSGTKYFGGHSDLLCGVLVAKTAEEWKQLHHDRTYLGNTMGSLEAWLLLRSLRTLSIRVHRQSETATIVAQWLHRLSTTPAGQTFDGVPGGLVHKVYHSSLQPVTTKFDPKKQLEGGWNATFAIDLTSSKHAEALPHHLHYFVPATSLGGVESLMEYRYRIDPTADPRLVRISIGLEDPEDLKRDLREALQVLSSEVPAKL
jgi:cystathionine gamma-synthase